jgi:hypothetical protein
VSFHCQRNKKLSTKSYIECVQLSPRASPRHSLFFIHCWANGSRWFMIIPCLKLVQIRSCSVSKPSWFVPSLCPTFSHGSGTTGIICMLMSSLWLRATLWPPCSPCRVALDSDVNQKGSHDLSHCQDAAQGFLRGRGLSRWTHLQLRNVPEFLFRNQYSTGTENFHTGLWIQKVLSLKHDQTFKFRSHSSGLKP